MTQRTKYRTGRRHRKSDKDQLNAHEKSLSIQEVSHQTELNMMNEKNALEQVETQKTLPDVQESVDEGVSVVPQEHVEEEIKREEDTESNVEAVQDIVETKQEALSDLSVEEASVAKEESSAVQVKPAKSGVSKVILGGVILASLAGGAYYCAQENHLFGLGADEVSTKTMETSVAGAMNEEVGKESHVDMSALADELTPVAEAVEMNTGNTSGLAESTSATSDDPHQVMMVINSTDTENIDVVEVNQTDNISTESVVANVPAEENNTSEETTLADNNISAEAYEAADRMAQQEKEIIQLREQLKQAQAIYAEQEKRNQASLSSALDDFNRLYGLADFQRNIRVSKENTLSVLRMLEAQLAFKTEAVWDDLRQAVLQDIQAIHSADDIDLEKLFKATSELVELVKTAPFVSAEGKQSTVDTTKSTSPSTVDTSAIEGSWLDQAINQVERLPEQAYEAIRSDLGGLIVVEKLSNPAVATMSIRDIQLQREETLRQVTIAQEALLKRQELIWKTALQKVEKQLTTYYNLNMEKTQQAVALTRQFINMPVRSSLPELSHIKQALEQLARPSAIEN